MKGHKATVCLLDSFFDRVDTDKRVKGTDSVICRLLYLLDHVVASAGRGVRLGLFFAPFLGPFVVSSPLLRFLFHVGSTFRLASVSPHFTQQSRDIRVSGTNKNMSIGVGDNMTK